MPATTQGVADRIARLTINSSGLPTGGFSNDTQPTDAQAQALLDGAAALMDARFGIGDTELEPGKAEAAEYATAAAVALSWDPTNFDLIDRLRTMAADALAAVQAGYVRLHPGTNEDGSSDQPIVGFVGTPGTVQYSFPPGPYDPCAAPLAERPLYGWGQLPPPPFDGRV